VAALLGCGQCDLTMHMLAAEIHAALGDAALASEHAACARSCGDQHGRRAAMLAADRAEAERRRARDLRYLDNVEHRLRDLVPAGADLRRCLSRMKDIRVGGEPIPPYLREFHEGNVALIYYELLTGPK